MSRACCLLVGLLVACTSAGASGRPAPTAPPAGEREVRVATTTTTQDTGLLDVLLPAFERRTGYQVKPIVQGSGAVLALAARGEADVLLTHSPDQEREWLAGGYGRERRLVMHNDFILVGPPDDPARVRAAPDATAALAAIASQGAPFVSRGDNSGTHARERSLWSKLGIEPRGEPWYVESGSGQGQTLTIADQRNAYALTDRGTWLAFQSKLRLALLLEGDPGLLNVYHVITLNPARFPQVRMNAAGGEAFAEFLLGEEGQRLIGDFDRDKYGQSLFIPDAGKREDELGG